MGCHGAINGLRVARPLAMEGSRVLLCAVELCSLHFHNGWNPQKLVANALFADGAAAAVLGRPDAAAPDAPDPWRIVSTGSCLIPDSHDAMTWDIEDHGFAMTLSPQVPELIEQHLPSWLAGWLSASSLSPAQVKSWIVHPGGPRVVGAVESVLGLKPSDTAASRDVLAECGNMSSPTILFILERLRRINAPRPCVALGFGPGLTAEGVLIV